MTQKRKVGPGGGDFALNPNRFSGGGGGRSGASIVKKARKKTAKPESSMKTKKKATRTRRQMERLDEKLYQAQLKAKRKSTYITKKGLKQSPDSRERVNIEGKGGLRKEVKAFRRTLDRQDESDTNVVKAYRFLQKSKHNQLKKGDVYGRGKDEGYRDSKEKTKLLQQQTRHELRYNIFKDNVANPKDPTVRKVIRKNKKLVKEKFKKQIKKDRAERKADKAKRRRN